MHLFFLVLSQEEILTVDGRESTVRRYMLVVVSHFIFLGAATTLPATMCWLPGVPKSNDEEEE